jgi:glycine betaine/proline transport system permease protein
VQADTFFAGTTSMEVPQRQSLWHVRLSLALPTIMVGTNQSLVFLLFMVIIAAFVGLAADHLINCMTEGRHRVLGL